MKHSLLITTACVVLLVLGPSEVEALCQQLTGWTPSYPDPADLSEHVQQAGQDNWVMCNLQDEHGNQFGLGSYQVRTDYARTIAAGFVALNSVVPAAIQGILNCGCQPGPCLANAVLELASAVNTTANQLIASGVPAEVAQGEALAAKVPAILAQGTSLQTSVLNSAAYPPQLLTTVTKAVLPNINPTAQYEYENAYPFSQVDLTFYQIPGLPVRLNGLNFAYNQDPTDLHRFTLSWSALDIVTSTPITGSLQLKDKYGPQLWGPNATTLGFYPVALPDGTVDHWTQSDQPWMAAEGVLNAGHTSNKVKGACWNARQWHTNPSLTGAQTGPYVWTPILTSSGIAMQLIIYYTNTSYLAQGSFGWGNIMFPVCFGQRGFNPASKYLVELDGRLCHPGPMQVIYDGQFTFTLSNPWNSTHGTGNFYWQTVHIQSTIWKLNLVVQALVPDNEIGWSTSPKGAFSEAPSRVTGTVNGQEIESLVASIEHLHTT